MNPGIHAGSQTGSMMHSQLNSQSQIVPPGQGAPAQQPSAGAQLQLSKSHIKPRSQNPVSQQSPPPPVHIPATQTCPGGQSMLTRHIGGPPSRRASAPVSAAPVSTAA